MRYLLFAAVVVVLGIPASSGQALARAHAHSHSYRVAVYRHHRGPHRLMMTRTEEAAPRLYNFAPADPVMQNSFGQDRFGQDRFGQDRFAHRDFGQSGAEQYAALDGMAAQAAGASGVPASLVERVIQRESGGNPRAVSRGNYGLMQIRLGTARAMGYSGSAAGLLDPQTNMTYAVRYLAGAYRAAGGNENRAVALYARGYYDVAKRQGFSPYAAEASSGFAAEPQQFAYQRQFAYQPQQFAYQMEEPYGGDAPVFRPRHRHHRAV
jgi:soluble lytic murein transglycosylase-like protein